MAKAAQGHIWEILPILPLPKAVQGVEDHSYLSQVFHIALFTFPPETSYGNQSPLKPFRNPPSQNLAAIPTTSSRDTRLPLLQPIATNSQPTEQLYLKSSKLPPQPARLSPLTDPNETKNLWAIVKANNKYKSDFFLRETKGWKRDVQL